VRGHRGRHPEGGGALGFFEVVVNLVRRHAPQAAIAFDSTPDDLVDAAQRWLTAD
jgi:hypothetical protein